MSLELLKEQSFFSIVLPAHNESENLLDVLRDLKKVLNEANIKSEIIVVDDGSSDNTEEILGLLKKEIEELKTLKIEKSKGYGNAIIKGLEIAQGSFLGFTDADGQLRAEDLVSVYQELKKNNLDFCMGARINRCDGFIRALVSKTYNYLLWIMFGRFYKDVNGCPKIFTRNFYETIKPQSKDFFIDAEILIKAKQNNFSVGEVPVVSLERKRGSSIVSVLSIFKLLKTLFRYFLFRRI